MENSTEPGLREWDGGTGVDSTFTTSMVLFNAVKQSVSAKSLAPVSLVVTSLAVLINSGVLAVLVRARRQFGSSVHTLITNQCAMDLFTSVFGMSTIVMMLTHGYHYNGNAILDGMVCMLFEGFALTALGVTASKLGLIVITLERYFKIVHAIAHRKHYRNWMTKVGVILPWFGGVCLVLFPGMGTTRIVNGRCLRLAVWPNKAMGFVSTHRTFLRYTALCQLLVVWLHGS